MEKYNSDEKKIIQNKVLQSITKNKFVVIQKEKSDGIETEVHNKIVLLNNNMEW